MGPNLNNPAQILINVCRQLLVLQEERNRADYDTASSFSRTEVLRLVGDARQAVIEFRTLPASGEKTVFLLGCLFGERLGKNA